MLSSIALIMLSEQTKQNLSCSQVHSFFLSAEEDFPVDHTNHLQDQLLTPKSWFHWSVANGPGWPSMDRDVAINIQSFEVIGKRIRSFYFYFSW